VRESSEGQSAASQTRLAHACIGAQPGDPWMKPDRLGAPVAESNFVLKNATVLLSVTGAARIIKVYRIGTVSRG